MPTPSQRLGLALPSQPDDFSTADLHANWSKIDAAPGTHICLSTSRPTWNANQAGRKIFETNTGVTRTWTGSTWTVYGYEPGDIKESARPTASEGWLACDGSLRSRSTFSHLFAAIGTAYNVGGEPGTDFRLPNKVGKVGIGRNPTSGQPYATIGEYLGDEARAIGAPNLPPHTHTIAHTHTIDHTHASGTTGLSDRDHYHTGVTEGGGNHGHSVPRGEGTGNAERLARGSASFGSGQAADLSGFHAHSFSTAGMSQHHAHSFSTPAFSGSSGGASNGSSGNGPGGSVPLSVMQPSVTMNYFIKI